MKLQAACISTILLAAQLARALDIWSPRQHFPAFVQPGGSFVAEVSGASNLPTGGWSASISNELRNWTCTVSAPGYGSIHQGKENGWRLPIVVPADAPPELFTLVVANTAGGNTNRVRAVKVVTNFEEDFYILQLTDQHVTAASATLANGNHQSGNGSTDAMGWAAPVINLINPRFVLVTGDNNQIYNSATDMCGSGGLSEATNRVRLYYGALRKYAVPSVIVDGNHDIGYSGYTNSVAWRAAYEDLVGQRVFSFRMGSFYVLGNEFTYNDYIAWARSDYNAAGADASIKYRLIAQHYPAAWVQVAYSTNPCNLMLVGHSHSTGTYQTSPYPVQVSGTSQDYQKASFYNFQRNAGGWTCSQATNHLEGINVWHLFGDWGSNAAVSATFTLPNNGTQASNSVSIISTLPQNFYGGRVKFLMPRGTYAVSNGTVEAQYDYNSGASTAVPVKMTILSNATTTVSIKPVDSPSHPQIVSDVQAPFLVMPGCSVGNSVIATGSLPLRYQWQFNGTNLTDDLRITGSQSNSLCISNARASDAGTYQVTVTNNYGTAASREAALLMGSLPISFFGTGPAWAPNGSARMTGSNVLTLTDPLGSGSPGSFFFQYPHYIVAFKAAFTYRAGGNRAADGATFCLHNDPRGWSALGGNGGNLGVSGISPSIELELNLYNGTGQVRGYTVLTNGLTGIRGTNGNYCPAGSVNLNSGDLIDITISYENGRMALTFTDMLVHTSFSTNLIVGDLTQVLGANTAYIGFTGSYGASTAVQMISNFAFVSIPLASIQLDGRNALVSWPGSIAGYNLQQNQELAAPNWVNVTNPDVLANGSHQVIIPARDTNEFYRLILPTP